MVLALTNIHKEKENWFCGYVSFTDSAGKFLTQSGLQYRYINPPLTYPCTAVYQVYHYSFYVINKSQWPPNYELNFTQMYQINELNDYIWMQVIDWRPNYTPNDFSGSIQLRNWGINTLKRKRLNTETETARSYSSKQNFFFKCTTRKHKIMVFRIYFIPLKGPPWHLIIFLTAENLHFLHQNFILILSHVLYILHTD